MVTDAGGVGNSRRKNHEKKSKNGGSEASLFFFDGHNLTMEGCGEAEVLSLGSASRDSNADGREKRKKRTKK